MWINAGPNKDRISQVHSPRELITGKTLDYNLHCKAKLYRVFLGIYIGPIRNIQGTVKGNPLMV